MPDLIDFHALFCQLQARYPTSSLITELAHAQEGRFTVRAIAQISGVPLASSLATAPTVEQAEDQARLRLLRLLGVPLGTQAEVPSAGMPMTPSRPLPPPFQDSGYESQAQLLADPLDIGPLLAAQSPAPVTAAATPPAATSLATPPAIADTPAEFSDSMPLSFEFDEFEAGPPPLKPVYAFGSSATTQRDEPDPPPAPPPVAVSSPAPKARATKGKAAGGSAPVAEPQAIAEPAMAEPKAMAEPIGLPVLDLTPIFLQIEDEMERIGWTKSQGRDHLKTAYSKRSRQELTDDELSDFLQYLKGCPAANAPIIQA